MKRLAVAAGLCAALLLGAGCKKQQNEKEAIRASIVQRLNSLKTLDLSAMDMDIKQVTINGAYAQAQVEFRPKRGAPTGVGMQVSYTLEKRDGAWVVVKSQTGGGEIIHPGGNQPSGDAPGSTPGALPPGHPPVKQPPETPKSSEPPKSR